MYFCALHIFDFSLEVSLPLLRIKIKHKTGNKDFWRNLDYRFSLYTFGCVYLSPLDFALQETIGILCCPRHLDFAVNYLRFKSRSSLTKILQNNTCIFVNKIQLTFFL